MPTNNATNTSDPVAISQGGTNTSSMANTDGVIYYDGTLLNTTTVGTAGQVLTSNGAAMAPSFQNATGASGGIVLLSSQTVSSPTANVDFTSVITGAYTNYWLIFSHVIPVTNTAFLQMLVSTNNGSSFITANGSYPSGVRYMPFNGTTWSINTDALTRFIPLTAALSNAAGGGANGFMYLFNTNNGAYFACTGLVSFNGSSSGGASVGWYGDGVDFAGPNGQIGVNAIRFKMSSGNIASGTFSLFGIFE